jgi:hypothetical protein
MCQASPSHSLHFCLVQRMELVNPYKYTANLAIWNQFIQRKKTWGDLILDIHVISQSKCHISEPGVTNLGWYLRSLARVVLHLRNFCAVPLT